MSMSIRSRLMLAFIFLNILSFFAACGSSKPDVPGRITIAVPFMLKSALVYLAEENGYFKQEGLQVVLTEYSTGKECLDAMLSGKADLAVCSHIPASLAAFRQEHYVILAGLCESTGDVRLSCRRDHGIRTVDDLEGARIGVQPGTSHHYFLDLFLASHGLSSNELKIDFGNLTELKQRFLKGDLDAIASAVPAPEQLRSSLGDSCIEFTDAALYTEYTLLSGTEAFAKGHPAALQGVLSALRNAQELMQESSESLLVLSSRLKLTPEELLSLLTGYHFMLEMNNSVLLALKDVGRWATEEHMTDQAPMPRFLNLIDENPLRQLSPETVYLTR